MECLKNYFILSGLIVNITGVVILFFTGLPPRAYENAQYVETEQSSCMKRCKFLSRIALCLLVLGSLLQILGVILDMP